MRRWIIPSWTSGVFLKKEKKKLYIFDCFIVPVLCLEMEKNFESLLYHTIGFFLNFRLSMESELEIKIIFLLVKFQV